MLSIKGPRQTLCDATCRRDFLRIGALGSLGLTLPALLRASEAGRPEGGAPDARARRCLLLFLTGGPPQHDTWDPKPLAPARIRGELAPIATSIPGIEFTELFPGIARHAGRLCVVRSVTHADNTHTSAGYTMLTGVPHELANAPGAAMVRPGPGDHPHVGAILSAVREPSDGAPVFAALPEIIKDAGVNEFPGLDGGFLGTRCAPFRIEATPDRRGFQRPEIFLPADVTGARLAERRLLRDRLARGLAEVESASAGGMDAWYERAFRMMQSPAFRAAFDLGQEPVSTREAYGIHLFGQGCLLARRLLEAGVALVTVYWHYEGPEDSPVWDTHQNNFRHLRERLAPPTDRALAALLEDLAQRGLLDDTLVVCMGEFGRGPTVNSLAGRDHWAAVQSVLLAGAGVPAGTVYGSSDRDGAYPASQAVAPCDLTATILHALGVPLDLELADRAGRPIPAYRGTPLFA